MQTQPAKKVIKGYLYVLIENFQIASAEGKVNCNISLGHNANCATNAHGSGTAVNEVFLIEVPDQPTTRLMAQFKEGQKTLGQCRFDINPFFQHAGSIHSMCSQIVDSSQEKKGVVNIKITYYSAEFGMLKIRVFHLSMVEPIVDHYKKAKLKIKIGIYAQSSTLWDMKEEFDQTLELLILMKNSNLDLDVVHQEGTLAKFTIYDLQKSNLLLPQAKAYKVSLFNKDKAVGTIKYQIDWIK